MSHYYAGTPQIDSVVKFGSENGFRCSQSIRLGKHSRLCSLVERLSKVDDAEILLIFIRPIVPTCGFYQLLR